jgi:hypothetical protein
MENETLSAEEQEIAAAFAEFTAEPGEKAVTKTPEELAAEAEAAKVALAAPAAKTPEELAAEAEAAKVALAAPAAKTPEELAAEAEAAKVAAELEATKAAEADAAKTAAAAAAKTEVDPELAALRAEIEALKNPKKPVAETPLYSAEEQVAITKYNEDWPDISKAEALVRRAEYRDLVGYIFDQIRQKYDPELESVKSYVHERSGTDQYSAIKSLVPDYDTVRDKALAWVETQPTYLKAAYQQVASEGSAADVADLINRFKTETKYVTPATPAAKVETPPAGAQPANITPAAKAAAAKLTVVKTGRTEAGTATEDTFETAFAAYAAEEEKRLSAKR